MGEIQDTELERLFYQQMYENRENEFVHNPYNTELREDAAIERGDVEELRIIMEEDFSGRYGKLAEDSLRQEKNFGIVTITTASRAAIRGGLRYEEAYTLSDICIQQMEKCRDPEKIRRLYWEAKLLYARLVRETHELAQEWGQEGGVKKSEAEIPNRNVKRCKDYISAHLHGKITVKEIAQAVGLDPNYLSALFVRCEKISLKQYIMKEKIHLVQKELVYSSTSFTDIAITFGFSSQSHMGAEFRKLTGMTPGQYRQIYQKEDFLAEGVSGTGQLKI